MRKYPGNHQEDADFHTQVSQPLPQKSRHLPLLRSCVFHLEGHEVPRLESLYHTHGSAEKIKIYASLYHKEYYSLSTTQINVTIYGTCYFTCHYYVI